MKRRTLVTLLTAGLVSTSWGVRVRSEWIPRPNPSNSYTGGYGSVSADTGQLPALTAPSSNTTRPPLPETVHDLETTIRTETDPSSEVEIVVGPETGTDAVTETDTVTETTTEPDPEPETQREPAETSPPPSSGGEGGGTDGKPELGSTPDSELPESGYGIDPYGHPPS